MAFIAKTDWEQNDLVETVEFNRIELGVQDNYTTIESHIADTNNPHNDTKDKIGLGNVDNTSAANKPTSRIYQKELDLKANKDLSNVTAKDFKDKAVNAGVGGDIIPDNKVRFNINLTSEDNDGIANATVEVLINNTIIDSIITDNLGNALIELEIDTDNTIDVVFHVIPINNRYEETSVTYSNIKQYAGTMINVQINLEKKPVITYGFTIDLSNSNPDTSIVYTDDCAGWTPIRGNNTDKTINMGSWANKWPLTQIKPCLYKDGAVVAYLNPNDYTKKVDGTAADITSGNAGDIMIEFPTIYYKVDAVKDSNNVTTSVKISVSDTEQEGFDCYSFYQISSVDINTYPAPTRKFDKLYIGAYQSSVIGSSTTLRSLSASGVEDTLTYAINSNGYSDTTPHPMYKYGAPTNLSKLRNSDWTLIKLLFVLLVKSLNSDNFCKLDYVPTSLTYKFIPSGWGDQLGMFAMEPDGKSEKFLGLENLYVKSYFTYISDVNQSSVGQNPSEIYGQGKYIYPIYNKNERNRTTNSDSLGFPNYTFQGANVNRVDNIQQGYTIRYYRPIVDDPYMLFMLTETNGVATTATYACDGLNVTNGYGNINSNSHSVFGVGGMRDKSLNLKNGREGLFSGYIVGNGLAETEFNDYGKTTDAPNVPMCYRLSTKYYY